MTRSAGSGSATPSRLERRRVQPAEPLSLTRAGDQACALEDLEMLRDGGKAHREEAPSR